MANPVRVYVIICYCRVSTDEQNLQRQIEKTTEYAQREFGVGLGGLEVLTDKSTGTDTERSAYREMMSHIDAGDVDAVVVNSVSRVARSIRDLDRSAERIADGGASLHILAEGLVMDPDDDDPYQRAMFQLLGVFAELEAAMIRQRVREGIATRMENDEYHHGPAPLGFEKDSGRLVEAANYDSVRTALDMVINDELSKRKAAQNLGTSRPTIDRSLDRLELYGLAE
jgi:DNA invertase Pin-like site-specific DNA recombinase